MADENDIIDKLAAEAAEAVSCRHYVDEAAPIIAAAIRKAVAAQGIEGDRNEIDLGDAAGGLCPDCLAKAAALADGIEDRVQQAYRAATAAQGIEGDRNEIDLGDTPTYIEELEAELARLRAIVESHEVSTADGLVVTGGETLYWVGRIDGALYTAQVQPANPVGFYCPCCGEWASKDDIGRLWHSTREAAQAAKEKR